MEFTQYVPPAPLMTMAEIEEAIRRELLALRPQALTRQVAWEIPDLQPIPPPSPLVRHVRPYDEDVERIVNAFNFVDIGEFVDIGDAE